MGIMRTPLPFEKDFVQIPNAWLRDATLSRRARGLLAELMTHRAGWHITVAGLQNAGPEGRDAIRNAILELADRGYLIRRQTQGERGRFNEIEYEISDPTAVGFSDTGGFTDDGATDDGATDDGPADVGESTTKNTSTQKTIDSEHHLEKTSSSPAATAIASEFDRVWQHWPKKVERKKSLAAFTLAAKKRGLEVLATDVAHFGDAYAATTDRQFVPALCAWLRGDRWDDEIPTLPLPSEQQWNDFLSSNDPSRRPLTRTEQNLAVVAEMEAKYGTHDHRWMPDGTCNFCTERRGLTAIAS